MATTPVLLFALLLLTASNAYGDFQPSEIQTIHVNVLNIRTLHMDFTLPFTWQATRGTSDLIIYHSKHMNVTLENYGNKTLLITVELPPSATSPPPTEQPSSRASSSVPSLVVITSIALGLALMVKSDRWKVWMYFFAMTCLMASVLAQTTDSLDTDYLHLLIPASLIEKIHQNGETWPVLCKFSSFSEYSSLPSNTELLFTDKYCKVKEPVDWEQWLESYFGQDSTQSYYGDYDADGLVNILEYYGESAFNGTYLVTGHQQTGSLNEPQRRLETKWETSPIPFPSTNPVDIDSDRDFLLDGFEAANLMNPLVPDSPTADYDNDLLSNLNEQIRKTHPQNPDTDGDGVDDGQELLDGGNPRNPSDGGKKPPSSQDAQVQLTIGDHSGSRSERYVLHVGEISHQSPDFGEIGIGTYAFTPGAYVITIQHMKSNQATPDYDYTAYVEKVQGVASVVIDDPEGILGVHNGNSDFYAEGKSATMIVHHTCDGTDRHEDDVCYCAKFTSCVACKNDSKCIWDIKGRFCTAITSWDWPWGTVSGGEICPCEECQRWYDKEHTDSEWLSEVNSVLPCPCNASAGPFGLIPDDQSSKNWKTDYDCMVDTHPYCPIVRPYAHGCLLSSWSSPSAAQQQCCYGDDGSLLPPAHPGAGRPGKAADFWLHQELDVTPHRWCCKDCEQTEFCLLYMDLRQADDSHCYGNQPTTMQATTVEGVATVISHSTAVITLCVVSYIMCY